jgi:type II secretory ATPase GspE/PulE/Tfp pilus assembly ATPase PilB-like protein
MSDRLREVMTAGGSVDQLRAVATEEGMRSLMQEALYLVSQGITGIEEVNRTLYGVSLA